MKLIKKIAAIMFAFMMVVSMSCNVKADDTTKTTEKGTITINKAVNEQTYTIYKLLDLESYDATNNHYSYKPATEWKSFFETAEAKNYITVDENGYANWVKGADQVAFAQKALSYATANKISNKGTKPASNNTVKFENLDLGYYLVDSSVGALCILNTTNPSVTIQEKNGVPSVDKKVHNGTDYEGSNNANIGDTIYFRTRINVKKGATNYILHDKMSKGLTYVKSTNTTVHALDSDGNMWVQASQPKLDVDYVIKKDNLGDDCSFHIEFQNSYLEKHADEEYVIQIEYSAILNENAVIAGEGNKNKTWLKYGENNNLETTHPTTTTKTFEMNVFKFYKDNKNSDKETGLANAVFTLSKNQNGSDSINLIDQGSNDQGSNVYRVAKTGETGTVTTITSPDSGKFTIKGLSAGTYKLEETKQPAGYNKLSGPVTVVIDMDGKVTVGGKEVTQVDVENKTGTVLPSTGGMGTTMIYLIGGVLVLGSGVVLVTKRRVKGK